MKEVEGREGDADAEDRVVSIKVFALDGGLTFFLVGIVSGSA